jgi:hypothetical protein
MAQIFTARGPIILADEADVDLLLDYSWYVSATTSGHLYAHARVRGAGSDGPSRILMHRLLMQPPPGMVVHHINNNGLDNRRQNLVVVTQAQNMAAHHYPNRSGVYVQQGRYRALVRINKKHLSLGMYDNKEDAYAAVRAARAAAALPFPVETFP